MRIAGSNGNAEVAGSWVSTKIRFWEEKDVGSVFGRGESGGSFKGGEGLGEGYAGVRLGDRDSKFLRHCWTVQFKGSDQ